MRIGVSLPEDLVKFADQEAKRRGTSRSALLTQLLQSLRIRRQATAYIELHGWDVAEDAAGWQSCQRERMAADYADDEW